MLPLMKRQKISMFVLILFFSMQTVYAQTETAESLKLSDCIQIALEHNSTLKTIQYADDAAGMDVLGSYQGILPTISLSARKGKVETGPSEYLSNEPVGIDPETGDVIYEQRTRKIAKSFRESSSASVNINQTIFDGGIWWNQIRKAKADKRSSEYNLASQRDNVILTVQQSYFDLIKQMKLLEVYQMAVKRSEAQLDRTEKMYELGATARLDVYRAKVNLGNDRINLLTQENVVGEARKNLNLAMGRDPFLELSVEAGIQLVENLVEVDEMITTAFENQPLISKNQEDIQSSKLSASMAKGVNYPRVSIYLNHDRFHEDVAKVFSDFDQNYQTVYGINLSMNIFNGFSDYVSVQKAQINKKSTIEQFEEYKRTLKAAIHQSYSDYNSLLAIIEINRQNLEAAKEEVRLAEERYQIGAGTSLEVREAQVNLTRAEETLIAAQYNARLILSKLDNQLGITFKKVESDKS